MLPQNSNIGCRRVTEKTYQRVLCCDSKTHCRAYPSLLWRRRPPGTSNLYIPSSTETNMLRQKKPLRHSRKKVVWARLFKSDCWLVEMTQHRKTGYTSGGPTPHTSATATP